MRREGRIHDKPTNRSRQTGKCRRARCRGCHEAPVSKSILKCKGSRKALSLSYIGPDWGLPPHYIVRYHDANSDEIACYHDSDDGEYGDSMPDDDHALIAHDGRRHAACSARSFDLILPAGFLRRGATPCASPVNMPLPAAAIEAGLSDSSSDSEWCYVNPASSSLDHIISSAIDDDDDDWYLC